eukprot:gb/GECG01009523.1/.p1 GENE.gb/GECG01009523.1/~~gb/GECG01009523.1/.p1  ORF type:complete len:135 (+),score=17.42 gb/GECG01009523.1/:1-405(+)
MSGMEPAGSAAACEQQALQDCIENGDLEGAQEILAKYDHVKLQELALQNGATPLHVACINGNADMCRVLVEQFEFSTCIINEERQHQTPLVCASSGGSLEIVKLLVERYSEFGQIFIHTNVRTDKELGKSILHN